MTVLIPEGALVGEGAVCDGDVIVVVVGGEGSTLVVGHGVTWRGDWGSEVDWQEKLRVSSLGPFTGCETGQTSIMLVCQFSLPG